MHLNEEQALAKAEHERWSLRHRLLDRLVEDENGCWVWTGAKTPHGYGTISTGPRGAVRQVVVHRVAWEVLVGPIAAGVVLDHLCGNRLCCNVHRDLQPVTSAENTRRKKTAKMTWPLVRELRRRFSDGEPAAALADAYGISREYVYQLVKEKAWKEAT